MYRKAFAISSFLLLLMLGAVAINNYNREWKQYQRQYFYELEREKQGDLSALDRLLLEPKLGMVKVVTDPGRSADMCMTCHINVGNSGFDEQPLVDLMAVHSDYILNNYPFDKFGCTACHGGQPLALSTDLAHEALRDNVATFLEEKIAELTAPDWSIRQKAIERIRWMTGDDFGYAQDAPPEEIEASIQRILDWWAQHRDTFFTEGFGDRKSPFKIENPLSEVVLEDTKLSPAGKPLKYVNNNSCIACHTSLYTGRLQEALDNEGGQEAIQRIQEQLDHIQLWGTLDLSDVTLSDEAFSKVAKNYSCQACHGPGEDYIKLMQKGYSLLLQGKGIESSDILKKAGEVARGNARYNLSDPYVWELLQTLAAKSQGNKQAESPEQQPETQTETTTQPEEATTPETPAEPTTRESPSSESADKTLIETGMQLAQSKGCLGCHSVSGSPGVGPSWLALFGKSETLDDGSTVTVDEAYLRKSILDPNAAVVAGFPALMPPYPLSDEELAALIAYFQFLSEPKAE